MKDVTIRQVGSADNDTWDSIWNGCSYATYFHSREWAEIWQQFTNNGMKPDPRLVVFSDGKTALLPLSVRKLFRGLATEYVSSPAGTFGGWLSRDELRESHAKALVGYLTGGLGNLTWRVNPLDQVAGSTVTGSSETETTSIINLAGSVESIFHQMSHGHKSAIQKAMKSGLTARLATNERDWDDYYRLYEETIRSWTERLTSFYPRDFFRILQARSPENSRLWLASHNERVVAGALVLYARHHAAYWHGAASRQHFPHHPVHFLLFEAIKHARETGYGWFDFNPSGGHEGPAQFKKEFGTIQLQCPVVRKQTGFLKLLRSIASIRNHLYTRDLPLLQ